jgi:hypothetical protein
MVSPTGPGLLPHLDVKVARTEGLPQVEAVTGPSGPATA